MIPGDAAGGPARTFGRPDEGDAVAGDGADAVVAVVEATDRAPRGPDTAGDQGEEGKAEEKSPRPAAWMRASEGVEHSQGEKRQQKENDGGVIAVKEPGDRGTDRSHEEERETGPAQRGRADEDDDQHGAEILHEHEGEISQEAGVVPAFVEILIDAPEGPKAGEERGESDSDPAENLLRRGAPARHANRETSFALVRRDLGHRESMRCAGVRRRARICGRCRRACRSGC